MITRVGSKKFQPLAAEVTRTSNTALMIRRFSRIGSDCQESRTSSPESSWRNPGSVTGGIIAFLAASIWGRIAAANALSDIYAMGGTPVVAINLVGWPREVLPPSLLKDVLAGGLEVGKQAGVPVIGGHSVDDPDPKYGMAVTGDVFPEAVESMTTLNREAAVAATQAGITAATDVTGFGLLGHLFKMCRASGVGARIDMSAVPVLDAARTSVSEGFIPGGSRRNLDWVKSNLAEQFQVGSGISDDDVILLADAQTSGGLLLVGEIPGHPVIGYTTDEPGIQIS